MARVVAVLLSLLGIFLLGFDRYLVWDLNRAISNIQSQAGIELVGTAITVLFIDWLNQQRQEQQLKQQFIREMASRDNGVTLRAVRELHARGWLGDGSVAGADLWGASLQGAELQGAHLERAILREAHLEKARLRGAHLQGADLIDAHLQGALLREANLERAELIGAHLEEACLREANLVGAYFKEATYDSETEWPEGFEPKAAGAINVDKVAR